MPGPVTIGAVVALAFGYASDAAAKAVIGAAAKDVYEALKKQLVRWVAGEATLLEKAPSSESRRMVLAEAIDALPAETAVELRALAESLIAALRTAGPIGLDLRELTNLEIKIKSLSVGSGTGVKIDGANGGKLEIDDLSVGIPSGKI